MEKNFLDWHRKKEVIDEKKDRVFFHEREIWFCHLGSNVGFEQDGKGENFGRPVIIFRKFNKEVFWGLPLTTREKGGKFYFPIDLGDHLQRLAILSQLRLIDAKRLYQKIGVINENTHKKLEEKIINLCRGL
ncbi:MAG: type II toxin-antitoxin system PemK/MazF family toxin [bacterium]|nr:type II toxin-antitoxin system PemK/MazF family toxin [bacterium]